MLKNISTLLCIGTLFVASSALAQETLRFGTNPEYPPFEYKTENNEIVGFDIDIANALCGVLAKKCAFVEQNFDALIPNLKLKRFDAIISAMDVTAERQKQISFSEPYYLNPSVFVTIKGTYNGLEELKGKKVGVLNGSTHQLYIKNKFSDATMNSYTQYPSAINDLLINRVDAVFGDEVVVAEFIKKNDQLVILGDLVSDPEYFGTGLAIGVVPKNTALLAELNKALSAIKESGRYQEIYEKWFK